jgi:hypothetical protein
VGDDAVRERGSDAGQRLDLALGSMVQIDGMGQFGTATTAANRLLLN